MKTRELLAIGFPAGTCAERARQVLQQARAVRQNMATVVDDLKRLAAAPATFVDHVQYGDLAQLLVDRIAAQDRFRPRESDAPYRVWGSDRAWAQLGTSGNHFVEFGELVVTDAGVGLQPGR